MTDIPILQTSQPTKTITVISGNLFDIAARELNDATQWTRIAILNKMTDPFFTGVKTLRIPSVNADAGTGGILYA